MEAALSPNYSHSKLENPCFSDLVDVLEDIWRSYIFTPTDLLLRTPHGDIAAMTVLCSYFEAIAGYIEGVDTKNQSKEFFVKGFRQVFSSSSPDIEKAAAAIYTYIRCGLAHEGMLRHKVNYSRDGSQAFFLTYRRASDGTLNIDAGVVSIIVNPLRMYQGVLQHFDKYVCALREEKDLNAATAFKETFGHSGTDHDFFPARWLESLCLRHLSGSMRYRTPVGTLCRAHTL